MSKQYEVVSDLEVEQVQLHTNKIPDGWIEATLPNDRKRGLKRGYLRPVCLPVPQNIEHAWEDYYREWQGSGGQGSIYEFDFKAGFKAAVDSMSLPAAGGAGEERLCVFCGLQCNPAPTERGWVDVPYNKGLHFDCARKVVLTANRVDEVEKSAALQLAGGQSAGVWVKASEHNPVGRVIDTYHVNIRLKDTNEDTFPSAVTFSGEWEMKDDAYEVVEWLDESLQPATTGESLLNEILHHIDTWADEPDRAMRLVRKITTKALTTSPNATERQEGEKMTEQELEDKFEACFDKNTSATGGGYEADYTNMQGLWNDFLPFIHQFANTTHTQ